MGYIYIYYIPHLWILRIYDYYDYPIYGYIVIPCYTSFTGYYPIYGISQASLKEDVVAESGHPDGIHPMEIPMDPPNIIHPSGIPVIGFRKFYC